MVSAGEGPAPVSLLPGASWAPLACVLVYCVRPTGEVVNDLILLPVRPFLANKVKSLSPFHRPRRGGSAQRRFCAPIGRCR